MEVGAYAYRLGEILRCCTSSVIFEVVAESLSREKGEAADSITLFGVIIIDKSQDLCFLIAWGSSSDCGSRQIIKLQAIVVTRSLGIEQM